ncbi:hypothetical protein, partial [Alloprevotella rava]
TMTTSAKLNFRSCQPKDFLTNRTVNLFQYRARLIVNILIAFENTIRMLADRIKLSTDALIVFFERNKSLGKIKTLGLSIPWYGIPLEKHFEW